MPPLPPRLAWYVVGIILVVAVYVVFPGDPTTELGLADGRSHGGRPHGRRRRRHRHRAGRRARVRPVRRPSAPRLARVPRRGSSTRSGRRSSTRPPSAGSSSDCCSPPGSVRVPAVVIQALAYVLATRVGRTGGSLYLVLLDLVIGLVGGWLTIVTGGIAAAFVFDALTRLGVFVATGSPDAQVPPEWVERGGGGPARLGVGGRGRGRRRWPVDARGMAGRRARRPVRARHRHRRVGVRTGASRRLPARRSPASRARLLPPDRRSRTGTSTTSTPRSRDGRHRAARRPVRPRPVLRLALPVLRLRRARRGGGTGAGGADRRLRRGAPRGDRPPGRRARRPGRARRTCRARRPSPPSTSAAGRLRCSPPARSARSSTASATRFGVARDAEVTIEVNPGAGRPRRPRGLRRRRRHARLDRRPEPRAGGAAPPRPPPRARGRGARRPWRRAGGGRDLGRARPPVRRPGPDGGLVGRDAPRGARPRARPPLPLRPHAGRPRRRGPDRTGGRPPADERRRPSLARARARRAGRGRGRGGLPARVRRRSTPRDSATTRSATGRGPATRAGTTSRTGSASRTRRSGWARTRSTGVSRRWNAARLDGYLDALVPPAGPAASPPSRPAARRRWTRRRPPRRR